ncbi:MAG: acetylhydrolase [Gemmatimonadaceae bacterium]|nr:acetylhydrolase [Acetobacteraceae bacterium]
MPPFRNAPRLLGRRLALGGAAALLAAADGAPANRRPVSAIPLSRLDTPWWRARHQAKLVELQARRVDLIWLGDSITQNWERSAPPDYMDFAPVWQRYYGDRNAVNLGFRGDNTAHLLWRMANGQLDGIRPRAAVVLIGANNLGRVRWSAPQTVAGIVAVVDELRRRQPAAGVVLIGILPSIRSVWATRTTNAVNAALATGYPPGGPVAFHDLSSLFLTAGQVDRTGFYDDLLQPPDPPLHPTVQAQARIAAAIEPTLAAMLGDRARLADRGAAGGD